MHPTFAYCAARYLDVWLRRESHLVDELKSPTQESLRSALAHFKVSRGFGGIDAAPTAATVISLLLQQDRYVTAKTAPKRVIALAADLEAKLGYDNLLSASSKLLWLRSRAPFVILDKRAADALELEGESFDRRDYESYVRAWRRRYAHHEKAIRDALTALPRFVNFTAAADRGPGYLEELVSEAWFSERTFDQYLWLVGAPARRATQFPDD